MAPTSFGGVATQNLGTTFAFGRESDLKNKLRKFYELKKFTKEKVRTWKQCAADYDNLINATFK